MIKVITRLCADTRTANRIKERLRMARLPAKDLHVLDAEDGASPEALVKRLTDLGVARETAATYAARMVQGSAVIMARATYKPLGAPRITREIMAASDTIDMGELVEETEVKEAVEPGGFGSILTDHPLFLTAPLTEGPPRGPVTAGLGMKMISRRKPPSSSVISGTKHFMDFFPLLTRRRTSQSAIPGGRLMTSFLPMLSEHRRGKSVIHGGGPVFSETLNLPTIIRR